MATQSFGITVIRPDDLLLLRIQFIDVDVASTPGLPPTITGLPGARMVVHFQPQHVAEEAFWEVGAAEQTDAEKAAKQPPLKGTSDPLPPPGQVRSVLAGPSRLAFTVPPTRSFLLTVEGVLAAITELPLSVTPVAAYETPAGCAGVARGFLPLFFQPLPPRIDRPRDDVTAIEVPHRLVLSPDQFAKWEHATKAVEHDGRVELWHTRLGSRRSTPDPRVRAVWSPDFRADPNDLQDHDGPAFDPFRTSLDSRDRNELVHLTSDYYIDFNRIYEPTPVDTRRFMLTGLGAWLDVQGDWTPPLLSATSSLTVEQWRHLATLGRDHYVKVVYAGFLFPFRHRASLVKVTERKFAFKDGGFIAYNFQRMFIMLRQRVRSYPDRDIPFRSIEITTRETPDLEKPELTKLLPSAQEAFWPARPPGPGAEFQFHCIGTDWENRQIEFTCPLIFVSKKTNLNIAPIVAAYNALGITDPRRLRPMNGQAIAFAPSVKPGDTTLKTTDLTFGAAPLSTDLEDAQFRPFMQQSNTDSPAVQQLLDKPAPSTIVWEKSYLQQTGNDIANTGDVFARITNTTKVEFAQEKSGGLIAPDMTIRSISRALGPMGGDPDGMVAGKMDPADAFKGITLMGGIELKDIVAKISALSAVSVAGQSLPQLITVRDGNVLRTTYSWRLMRKDVWHDDKASVLRWLKDPAAEALDARPVDDPDGPRLRLTATLTKPLNGGDPIFRTEGKIRNFEVVLMPNGPLARLQFRSITFVTETGKKLDTSVDFQGIEFDGILEFVNELQRVIPLDGFSDPPSVQLIQNPPGVQVGFSLGLPTIGVGVMTMQNIALSAAFYLPFIGDQVMTFRFAFCERHQPFILTVSLFGGGGFFAITLGLTKKVLRIEAALEFGASIALNLGVASGQATIMAGFYFQMTDKGFSLTGYFRACGSLSVLGIITVSVEFYLGLTYETKEFGGSHPGKLWGQATLTVKIKILFFSVSVGVSLEREFAGSDPTFRELVAPSDWALYCGAFSDDYPAIPGD